MERRSATKQKAEKRPKPVPKIKQDQLIERQGYKIEVKKCRTFRFNHYGRAIQYLSCHSIDKTQFNLFKYQSPYVFELQIRAAQRQRTHDQDQNSDSRSMSIYGNPLQQFDHMPRINVLDRSLFDNHLLQLGIVRKSQPMSTDPAQLLALATIKIALYPIQKQSALIVTVGRTTQTEVYYRALVINFDPYELNQLVEYQYDLKQTEFQVQVPITVYFPETKMMGIIRFLPQNDLGYVYITYYSCKREDSQILHEVKLPIKYTNMDFINSQFIKGNDHSMVIFYNKIQENSIKFSYIDLNQAMVNRFSEIAEIQCQESQQTLSYNFNFEDRFKIIPVQIPFNMHPLIQNSKSRTIHNVYEYQSKKFAISLKLDDKLAVYLYDSVKQILSYIPLDDNSSNGFKFCKLKVLKEYQLLKFLFVPEDPQVNSYCPVFYVDYQKANKVVWEDYWDYSEDIDQKTTTDIHKVTSHRDGYYMIQYFRQRFIRERKILKDLGAKQKSAKQRKEEKRNEKMNNGSDR